MSLRGAQEVSLPEEQETAVYQTIYEDSARQTFGPVILKPLTAELEAAKFVLESLEPAMAVYRDGERYIVFNLKGNELSVRIGMGSLEAEEAGFNSMRLDEMIHFLFGSLKRGCHFVEQSGLQDCLAAAMKDLKEFAPDFLRGDFRQFLRVLSLKRREELAAKKDPSKQIYLA